MIGAKSSLYNLTNGANIDEDSIKEASSEDDEEDQSIRSWPGVPGSPLMPPRLGCCPE